MLGWPDRLNLKVKLSWYKHVEKSKQDAELPVKAGESFNFPPFSIFSGPQIDFSLSCFFSCCYSVCPLSAPLLPAAPSLPIKGLPASSRSAQRWHTDGGWWAGDRWAVGLTVILLDGTIWHQMQTWGLQLSGNQVNNNDPQQLFVGVYVCILFNCMYCGGKTSKPSDLSSYIIVPANGVWSLQYLEYISHYLVHSQYMVYFQTFFCITGVPNHRATDRYWSMDQLALGYKRNRNFFDPQ